MATARFVVHVKNSALTADLFKFAFSQDHNLFHRLKQSYTLLPKQKVFIKIQRYSDDNSSRPPWHLNLVGKGDKGYKKKFICLWMSRLDRGTNKLLSVDPKGGGRSTWLIHF